MERVDYSKRLVGSTTELAAGALGRKEAELPDGVRLESEMLFGDDTNFRESGTIVFGPGSELRFRTLGTGRLTPSPDPTLRHGTVTWELDGGVGAVRALHGSHHIELHDHRRRGDHRRPARADLSRRVRRRRYIMRALVIGLAVATTAALAGLA